MKSQIIPANTNETIDGRPNPSHFWALLTNNPLPAPKHKGVNTQLVRGYQLRSWIASYFMTDYSSRLKTEKEKNDILLVNVFKLEGTRANDISTKIERAFNRVKNDIETIKQFPLSEDRRSKQLLDQIVTTMMQEISSYCPNDEINRLEHELTEYVLARIETGHKEPFIPAFTDYHNTFHLYNKISGLSRAPSRIADSPTPAHLLSPSKDEMPHLILGPSLSTHRPNLTPPATPSGKRNPEKPTGENEAHHSLEPPLSPTHRNNPPQTPSGGRKDPTRARTGTLLFPPAKQPTTARRKTTEALPLTPTSNTSSSGFSPQPISVKDSSSPITVTTSPEMKTSTPIIITVEDPSPKKIINPPPQKEIPIPSPPTYWTMLKMVKPKRIIPGILHVIGDVVCYLPAKGISSLVHKGIGAIKNKSLWIKVPVIGLGIIPAAAAMMVAGALFGLKALQIGIGKGLTACYKKIKSCWKYITCGFRKSTQVHPAPEVQMSQHLTARPASARPGTGNRPLSARPATAYGAKYVVAQPIDQPLTGEKKEGSPLPNVPETAANKPDPTPPPLTAVTASSTSAAPNRRSGSIVVTDVITARSGAVEKKKEDSPLSAVPEEKSSNSTKLIMTECAGDTPPAAAPPLASATPPAVFTSGSSVATTTAQSLKAPGAPPTPLPLPAQQTTRRTSRLPPLSLARDAATRSPRRP